MSSIKYKTVFVLGAGFSYPALRFGQAGILEKLKEKRYKGNRSIFGFISKVFGGHSHVPLEDVYTALDRSILEQQWLKGYSPRELLQLRYLLSDSITKLFVESAEKRERKQKYIIKFSNKLCKFRWDQYNNKKNDKSKRYHEDRIAIVSLNWDVLLDRQLGQEMDHNSDYRDVRKGEKKKERLMFMDFCMFDFKWEEHRKYKNIHPSLRLKPAGYVNLKYLKLHGSMNWFRCPNCTGIFVKLDINNPHNIVGITKNCRICKENDPRFNYKLARYFVTPTFLKDFTSAHFRSIWWNAGYELAQAKKVVFIGYSLPLADYDFKYWLAKHLPKKVQIQIVLSEDAPDYKQSRKNYMEFFGSKISGKDIYSHGVEKYVEKLVIT